MSYTPTTWAAGDTVTAAKLNKLEQGVASSGGVLYVTASYTTLDKNFEEIQTALDGEKVVMFKRESPNDGVFYGPLINTASVPEGPYYAVTFYDFGVGAGQKITFSNTTSPTDPLVYEE